MEWFKAHHGYLLVVMGFVLLSALFLGRNGFWEFDSYYYFNLACGIHDYGNVSAGLESLAHLLPCNELLLKVGILFLYGTVLVNIFLLGKVWFKDDKRAILLVLAFFATPTLLFAIVKLENDTPGIALSFLSLPFYFFAKKATPIIQKAFYLVTITLLISAFYFWEGAGLIILALLCDNLPIIPSLILTLAFATTYFFPPNAAESLPIWGIMFFYIYFMFMGFSDLQEIWKQKFFMPLMVIGTLNPKFFFYSILFYAKILTPKVDERLLGFLVGGMIIWSFTFSGIPGFQSPPTELQKQAVLDTIQLARDQNLQISNDFEYGHLIFFYGGTTHDAFGINASKDFFALKNQIVLTVLPLNCEKIKTYSTATLGEKLKLFKC